MKFSHRSHDTGSRANPLNPFKTGNPLLVSGLPHGLTGPRTPGPLPPATLWSRRAATPQAAASGGRVADGITARDSDGRSPASRGWVLERGQGLDKGTVAHNCLKVDLLCLKDAVMMYHM